jgi:hypothetical protein
MKVNKSIVQLNETYVETCFFFGRANVRTSSSNACNCFASDVSALTSDPAPANLVQPPATDPAPVTVSEARSLFRLRPRHQARHAPSPATPCSSPTAPRSFPRRGAPVLRCTLSRPRPFSCPNVSSPPQHPSDRCNICSILLKHTCIVITTLDETHEICV